METTFGSAPRLRRYGTTSNRLFEIATLIIISQWIKKSTWKIMFKIRTLTYNKSIMYNKNK